MFFRGLRTSAADVGHFIPAAVGEQHEDHGQSQKFGLDGLGRLAVAAGDGRRRRRSRSPATTTAASPRTLTAVSRFCVHLPFPHAQDVDAAEDEDGRGGVGHQDRR